MHQVSVSKLWSEEEHLMLVLINSTWIWGCLSQLPNDDAKYLMIQTHS